MMQDYFKSVQRRVLASAQLKELDEELKRAREQFNLEFKCWSLLHDGRKR